LIRERWQRHLHILVPRAILHSLTGLQMLEYSNLGQPKQHAWPLQWHLRHLLQRSEKQLVISQPQQVAPCCPIDDVPSCIRRNSCICCFTNCSGLGIRRAVWIVKVCCKPLQSEKICAGFIWAGAGLRNSDRLVPKTLQYLGHGCPSAAWRWLHIAAQNCDCEQRHFNSGRERARMHAFVREPLLGGDERCRDRVATGGSYRRENGRG
jgi:hypothetical protein